MNRSFFCDDRTIVEIDTGKVRGCFHNGVYYFRGIPYAKAERFMMPEPADPWDGVRDAVTYGRVAPTIKKPDCHGSMSLALEPLFGYRYRPEGEDCHFINVWTKDIKGDSKKKPVMVWIHGGSFATGSSVEQMSYDGANLCRDGDVVVVSMNHRLNVLGYLDLSEYGEKYKNSGNAGLADLVLALQWVQNNIEKFGGDPDNVTLFGQSGGGGKIMCLLQTPCADNLYHKCILQSGLQMQPYTDEEKRASGPMIAAALIKELGLTAETIDEIQTVPFERLREAYLKIEPGFIAQGYNTWWAPRPDGEYYVGSFMEGDLTEKAKNTPCLVGCTAAEHCLFTLKFLEYDRPEEEKLEYIRAQFREGTDQLLDLFKKTYPEKDLMHLYHMDSKFRTGVITFSDKRAKLGAADTYAYMLDYDFGFFGTMPSFHGAELPMVFNNTDYVDAYCEPDAQALGIKMSTAWAQFAHTGDPNISLLPEWPPYAEGDCATMVFGHTCEVKRDYDRELIAAHIKFAPERALPVEKKEK